MKSNKTIRVEITESQFWLVTRALVMLSSPEGEMRLHTEYPNLDLDALADDFGDLLSRLEKANKGA